MSTVIALSVLATNAKAEVVSAGEPIFVRVESFPDYIYPDIYQRQLAYRDTFLALQDDLRARQKAFIAPSLEAQEQYKENLQAIHESLAE